MLRCTVLLLSFFSFAGTAFSEAASAEQDLSRTWLPVVGSLNRLHSTATDLTDYRDEGRVCVSPSQLPSSIYIFLRSALVRVPSSLLLIYLATINMASTTTTNPTNTVTTTLNTIGDGTPILCDSPYPLITTTGASAHPEIPKDHYCIEAAYTMAQIHNTILRGINSIYNQCLTTQPGTSQAADFITYNQFVFDFLHHHHRNEEDVFFPYLRKVTGDDKFCDAESQEHAEFDIGAEKWKQYIFNVKPEDYDAIKLRGLIEEFGRPLHAHLVAEIEWLLTLSKYDSEACKKAFLDTGKKAEAEMSFYK
jgi:hemerythrin-like domain-containing protein